MFTTWAIHQSCFSVSSCSVGRCSFTMLRLTRHSSFFALHLFMVAMYSLRPMPTSRTMSAACSASASH